jgi:hypothetical protein
VLSANNSCIGPATLSLLQLKAHLHFSKQNILSVEVVEPLQTLLIMKGNPANRNLECLFCH